LSVSSCTGLMEQRFVQIPAGNGICSSMRDGVNCVGNDIVSARVSPQREIR
jgi:hypothetical protein